MSGTSQAPRHDPGRFGLNEGQQSSLEVTLQMLEIALFDIRRLLGEPLPNTLLTHFQPCPPELAAQIEPLIDDILAEIDVIVQRFQLGSQELIVSRNIRSEMAMAWSDLNDLRFSKLKRYGHVDPALQETLEPHIQRLIHLTSEVGSIAEKESAPALVPTLKNPST
jgi:hypothetical protein